jgi:Putative amidoligase enzyme
MPSTNTFGIEIECYMPAGTTCAAAARLVSASTGLPMSFVGYDHHRSENWKVVTDGSLHGGNGMEFVSPPLEGEAGLEQVAKVCRAIVAAGGTVNHHCGLHVHVGMRRQTAAEIKSILEVYNRYEPVLDMVMPPSRRGSSNVFCKSLNDDIRSVRALNDVSEIVRHFQRRYGSSARYFKVNVQSLTRHGTIEFRQHSGTIDETKVVNWARFCLKLVDASIKASVATPVANVPASTARVGSKTWQVGELLRRPGGAEASEIYAVFGKTCGDGINIPAMAKANGLVIRKVRGTGRRHRYEVVAAATEGPALPPEIMSAPVTIDALLDKVEAGIEEKAFFKGRYSAFAERV